MSRHRTGSGNQRSLQQRVVGVENITVQVHYEFNILLDATDVAKDGAVSAHVMFFTKKASITPKTIEIAINNRAKVVQAPSIEIEPIDYHPIVEDPKRCAVNFSVTASLPIASSNLKKKHYIVFEIEDQHHADVENQDQDHDHDHEEETLQHFKEIKAAGTHQSEHITIEKIQLLKK